MTDLTNQLEPLSLARPANRTGAAQAAPPRPDSAKVQTEFLTIFYKEMLKEVFTTPKFSVEGEESGFNSAISAMNSDLMAEKMAEHMVKNALANSRWSGMTGEDVAQ